MINLPALKSERGGGKWDCSRGSLRSSNHNGEGYVGDDVSVGATGGGSLLADERGRVIRWCEEVDAGKTERRRGYACGAAWDEGNMIQAMARLKNPTIAWRYGDG